MALGGKSSTRLLSAASMGSRVSTTLKSCDDNRRKEPAYTFGTPMHCASQALANEVLPPADTIRSHASAGKMIHLVKQPQPQRRGSGLVNTIKIHTQKISSPGLHAASSSPNVLAPAVFAAALQQCHATGCSVRVDHQTSTRTRSGDLAFLTRIPDAGAGIGLP